MGNNYSGFFIPFFATLIILFSATISINFYVNSYGYYGDEQLGDNGVFNAEIAKYDYLKQARIKPKAIVLGSSNSMRMLPKTIDSLFGLSAYNYGVYQATVEDFYCISNALIRDLKILPALMIICVDDWNFAEYPVAGDVVFKGGQNRLCYKWRLSQYLKDFSWITLRWCQLKSAISYEQTASSISILKTGVGEKKIPDISKVFLEGGVRKKYSNEDGEDITDLAEQGKYKATEALQKFHEKSLKLDPRGLTKGSHEDFKNLEPERLKLFEELIQFLEKNKVKVILNIMPVQPYVQQVLIEHTSYAQRMSLLAAYLNDLKNKYPNIILVKDNHEIKNFNGLSEHFFDRIHPTSVNSDSMLVSIKRQLIDYAF